ncbi:hypothetical protein RI509_11805 [Levilactobacillus namurensis]|uniref:hypothetical protein n=2 Tax=Levilactobacillus namurensis TaxID=380393 RepID=UPI0028B2E3E9|nr:hypothetical protein [Levilactobacillus namurensis]MDT7019860.1 hypothetical protein [Levilactobacillus namurensis]
MLNYEWATRLNQLPTRTSALNLFIEEAIKMHRFTPALLITLTTFGLALATPAPTATAQAATWHKGTPKIIRGKWRGTTHKVKQIHYQGHADLLIKAKSITNNPALPPRDPDYSTKLHYKKTGKKTYTIKGRQYNNASAKGVKITFKIKVYSHHKLHFKIMHDGRTDNNGIFHRA